MKDATILQIKRLEYGDYGEIEVEVDEQLRIVGARGIPLAEFLAKPVEHWLSWSRYSFSLIKSGAGFLVLG